MTSPHRPDAAHDLDAATWRTSSFSGHEGSCVETALLADGSIAVRNSNDPEADVVFFTRAEMDAWIKGVKAGEFDDLA
jgi:Domain of unknown function (DUF397)